MADPISIVFPIYPGVTHLDFTGPHQFLSQLPGARAIAASVGGIPIEADGLVFSGLSDLTAIERCDVLCIPGGFGCIDAMQDTAFIAAIRRLAATAHYVTSVCTGSLILGAAGLLKGRRAACHWAWRELLTEFGAIPGPGRVVRDGAIITGGGVTAGIDFALTLMAELAGREVAETIQLRLEYAPEPPFDAGRPEIASQAVLEAVMARMAAIEPARRAGIRRAAEALHARVGTA
ncbi:MAG TPA: DJ-1/PfpI family protein [Acidiphilium sp.]